MAKRKDKAAAPKPQEDSGASASSRSRTRERREEREREKRRRQQITLIGVVVVAAVIVMVLIFFANQPAEAPIPEDAIARYAEIPQSKTEKGYPMLGNPDAPVQVVEYSSFDCPSCARFHEEDFPGLLERIKSGDIAFTFVPLFGTGGIPNGEGAARAAICAGEQGQFWTTHDTFFSWQKLYGQQSFSQNRILSAVDNLKIDRARYDQCVNSDVPGRMLTEAMSDRDDLGEEFTGTPSIFVNGVATQPTLSAVNAAIDSALALVGATPGATPEVTPEATAEATEAATASAARTEGVIDSVCLVTDVGVLMDRGFNQFANEGMMRAAEEFDLNTTFIETQAQTDYAANINTCISEGYAIVVTVGWALADAMRAAAVQHPDLYFIGADQIFTEPLPNVVGLQFREDQGGFLAGAMAAMMTESNVVAGIYGPPEPPILKFRNGFEQGVKYINPEVKVLGVYIDDYNAPDRGIQAATQFIGDGADVIFGAAGQTGSGGITRAAQEGVKVIGVDLDEYFTTFGGGETPGAQNLIMSAIKRVDAGVYDMIKAAVVGEGFPSDSTYMLGAANGGISFSEAHDADVPEEVTERLTEILEGLRDGSIMTGVDPVTGELLEPVGEATAEATTEADD